MKPQELTLEALIEYVKKHEDVYWTLAQTAETSEARADYESQWYAYFKILLHFGLLNSLA